MLNSYCTHFRDSLHLFREQKQYFRSENKTHVQTEPV